MTNSYKHKLSPSVSPCNCAMWASAFLVHALLLFFHLTHGEGTEQIQSIGGGCSKEDVVLYQGPTSPLPNGIPTYTVQILNTCIAGCAVSDIHVSCGWFSSARLVNPRVFRRLQFDDCLVNDGGPLGPGQSLSFQYANTFSYPLSISSVSCG